MDDDQNLLKEVVKWVNSQPLIPSQQPIVDKILHMSNKRTNLHPTLKALKKSVHTFEQSEGIEEFRERSYEVLQQSKSVLDYSMNYLKEEAFPGAGNVNIFFPYQSKTAEELENKFEEMNLHEISQKFPRIIPFVLKKNQLPKV